MTDVFAETGATSAPARTTRDRKALRERNKPATTQDVVRALEGKLGLQSGASVEATRIANALERIANVLERAVDAMEDRMTDPHEHTETPRT